MKLDELIATVTESLRENGADPKLTAKVIADIEKAAAEAKTDKSETPKKTKYDWAVLVSDPEGVLKKLGTDLLLTGWVFQLESGANPATLPDRVKAAAVEFNNSRKGRRVPVTTIGETIQNVASKFWKSQPGRITRVKSKEPVYLVTTDNKI